MNTRLLVALSVALSTLVLVPGASAQDDPCSNMPDRVTYQQCASAWKSANLAGCDGGEKGYQGCGANQCPQEPAREREATGPTGCAEFVCGAPDWNNVTPEGGEDCLDMLCRNVPPVIQLVQIQLAPVVTLLGNTIPGATVVRAIVLNAGFYCERGTGTGGPGNPCQHVLSTPVGRVGADPEAWIAAGGEKGTECSWAQSGVTGYNYAYTNAGEWVSSGGDCSASLYLVVVMGARSENYRFTDGCTP